jgi:hypothetical protein
MVLGQVVAGLSQLSVQRTLGRSWIDGGISGRLVQLGAGTGEEPDDQSCGSRLKIVYSLSEGTGCWGAVHWAVGMAMMICSTTYLSGTMMPSSALLARLVMSSSPFVTYTSRVAMTICAASGFCGQHLVQRVIKLS